MNLLTKSEQPVLWRKYFVRNRVSSADCCNIWCCRCVTFFRYGNSMLLQVIYIMELHLRMPWLTYICTWHLILLMPDSYVWICWWPDSVTYCRSTVDALVFRKAVGKLLDLPGVLSCEVLNCSWTEAFCILKSSDCISWHFFFVTQSNIHTGCSGIVVCCCSSSEHP